MRTACARAAMLLALVTGCGEGTPPAVNPNDVDAALLRPKLLDDSAFMRDYLAELPPGVYKVYRVETIGSFYLDGIKDVIKSVLRRGFVWEPHLVELFPRHVKAGSTVIDVGAHIGTHTLTLARLVGPQGRVYSFEPQRKIYRELVHNLRLNGAGNVVPLRFALGDAPGVVEMSRAVLDNEGGTPIGVGGDKAEMRTLDSFGFRNVSLIKIDVEGYEDHVLEGAKETIARNRPVIVIEIHGGQTYQVASKEMRGMIESTRGRLEAMGYHTEQIRGHDYLATPK